MANLKELRNRRQSISSTKKITSAMKMIAAAKLKKAQEAVEAARPYAQHMRDVVEDLVQKRSNDDVSHPLLNGTGSDGKVLFLVLSSNRGLCGGFNSNLVRKTLSMVEEAEKKGQQCSVVCWGRRAYDALRRSMGEKVIKFFPAPDTPSFAQAEKLCKFLIESFDGASFDQCTVVYTMFASALSQHITHRQLIPFSSQKSDETSKEAMDLSLYTYEPSRDGVLQRLLPRNIRTQLYQCLLESAASEHGARMTAMDSATRNAQERADQLNLEYNRTRQAYITRELIEIISGAEAL